MISLPFLLGYALFDTWVFDKKGKHYKFSGNYLYKGKETHTVPNFADYSNPVATHWSSLNYFKVKRNTVRGTKHSFFRIRPQVMPSRSLYKVPGR